jgi:lipoate-protein ligase B
MRILKAGILEHKLIDDEMRRLQKMRIAREIVDTIIFVEHPEIITIGPRAKREGVEIPEGFASRGVDRGGGLTWHGKGQVVAYPIIEWKKQGEENVARIVNILEEWILSALRTLGIEGRRDERMQGVWVGDNKIASIGLSFFHWTSRHGFTINYDTPEGRLELVSGCGLGEATTTSLSALGYSPTRDDIHNALIETAGVLKREITEIIEVGLPPWA